MVRYPANWSELKKKVLKRDHYTCTKCSAKNVVLQVHHIIPLSNNGSNAMSNLTTLCKLCHKKEHPHMTYSQVVRWILAAGGICLLLSSLMAIIYVNFIKSTNLIFAGIFLLVIGFSLVFLAIFLKKMQIKYFTVRKKYRKVKRRIRKR